MNAAPGMNAPELFEQYRRLSDVELEQLLMEFDDLLETAQSRLIAELQTRGQTDKTISATIEAGRKLKLPLTLTDGYDPGLTKKIGSVSSFHGIGRIFYGKAHSTFDETFAFEEFDTTLWWIFFWIPLFPEGCFRIRRKQEERPFTPYTFVVVQRIPFLWVQNIFRLILTITYLSLFACTIISAILRRL